MRRKFLIFTDLDGTLLNHDNYSYIEASEALNVISEREIPLIITTSKTFAEVKKLQEELDLKAPCIVENGAGIFIPNSCVLAKEDWHREDDWIKISQAKSYLESRLFLKSVKHKYKIRGFGDMEIEEVMALTDLDEGYAADAMKRDFTEPFVIEDEKHVVHLTMEANAKGFGIVKGGRFYHLISLEQDKSKAMRSLQLMYEEYFERKFCTIALGDSSNDLTMLKEANLGVLIPKPDGRYDPLFTFEVLRAPFPGPKGWNSVILGILDAN